MHAFNNQLDDIKTTTKYFLETRKYQLISCIYTEYIQVYRKFCIEILIQMCSFIYIVTFKGFIELKITR